MDRFVSNDIGIQLKGLMLQGILTIPNNAQGLIIFSHGSGSSRLSPRNNYVARELNQKTFATLLFDLLTEEEDSVYENRFDIGLLTERLIKVTEWAMEIKELSNQNIGYFGASTGAASALNAAAEMGSKIKAIVSRGGRPDLAGTRELSQVLAPTLFIVGALDDMVLPLNQKAYDLINSHKMLEIVPGATHLFEEPGKLELVTALSVEWFKQYLTD